MSTIDTPFVFYELKRKDQSIVVEILCHACYQSRPEAAHPLTEREIQAGYRYSVRPYTGDHECMQCEKSPTTAPVEPTHNFEQVRRG